MSLSSGDRLGQYEILTIIDECGMGAVYRAREIVLVQHWYDELKRLVPAK